jgi:hypothetical protein
MIEFDSATTADMSFIEDRTNDTDLVPSVPFLMGTAFCATRMIKFLVL